MDLIASRVIYAPVIIKLLQGPIYADEKSWRDLLAWQVPIQEYFARIGIELNINQTEGFGRIIQPETEEHDENPMPRLLRKQALSYEASLLCVILREILEEFDIKNESTKLFLTQKDIKERIEIFYKEQSNKSRLWRELAKPIAVLQNVGILRLTREDPVNRDNNQYEVRRIIKALVNNDKLEEIKQKLQAHVNTIQQQ